MRTQNAVYRAMTTVSLLALLSSSTPINAALALPVSAPVPSVGDTQAINPFTAHHEAHVEALQRAPEMQPVPLNPKAGTFGGISPFALTAQPSAGWEEVGAGSASGGGISNNGDDSHRPSLAIAPDGTPYVAWHEYSGGFVVYVRRWNGSSWEELGAGLGDGGGTSAAIKKEAGALAPASSLGGPEPDPDIAIAPDGTPYLAWSNTAGNSAIYVRRWNGSSWVEVGAGSASGWGVSLDVGYSPSMAVAPDGMPYVAWEKYDGNDYEIYVRRWNGSSWEEVGTGSASGGGISNSSSDSYDPSAVVGPDGTPYIAWTENPSGEDSEIYLRRWSGSGWLEVGSGSASSGGISDNSGYSWSPSLAIAPDGTPYVAWYDYGAADSEIYVRSWNGRDWAEVGPGSATGGGISNNDGGSVYPSIAIAPDNVPFVAWSDSSDSDEEIYIGRWNGSCWVKAGSESTSGGGVSDNGNDSFNPSMAIASDGTPYVAWEDENGADNEIYVRKWDGGPPDNTAPATISDLSAAPGSDAGEVVLSWTAPGDDGSTDLANQYDVRYSASPINTANWGFASRANVQQYPAAPGSTESLTVTVPFPGQQYYFAIKTADDVPNWSGLSDSASAVSALAPDTLPPGRITDLVAVTGASTGRVDLSWTAPGDDGDSGIAHHYVVRRHTVPINDRNWNSANDVTGEPAPWSPGSSQSMTVWSLVPGKQYYFAIRTYDEASNHSGISNSPDATAFETALPDLTVTALSVNPASADPGDSVTVDFAVRNDGGSSAGLHACTVYLARYRNGSSRVELGNRNISSLVAGGTANHSLSVQIPSDTQPGNHYIVVVVDSGSTVRESNEHNNERDQYPFAVQGEPSQIDLKIVGIEVTQGIQVYHLKEDSDGVLQEDTYHDPGYGDDFPYVQWRNQGPGNNDVRLVQGRTTVVRVYVDIDPPTSGQIPVTVSLEYNTGSGWRKVSAADSNSPILLRGAEMQPRVNEGQTANFLIRGWNIDSTTLSLRARLDPADEFAESNEGNNMLERQVAIHEREALRIGLLPIKMLDEGNDVGTGEINDGVLASVNYARAALPFPDWISVGRVGPAYEFNYDWWKRLWNGDNPKEVLKDELEALERDGLDVIVGVFPAGAENHWQEFSIYGSSHGIGEGHHVVLISDEVCDARGSDRCAVLAHELSHLIPGLRHPVDNQVDRGNACDAWDPDTDWPYNSLCLQEIGVAVREFDWRVGSHRRVRDLIWWNPNPTTCSRLDCLDLMSYCPYSWVSPYSWEAWMSSNGLGMKVLSADSPSLVVSGVVYTDSMAHLGPIWASDTQIPPPTESGEYCVHTLDNFDAQLDQVCFDLAFLDNDTGMTQSSKTFLVSLPANPSAAKVQITHNSAPMTQVVASSSPPTVTLTYPNGGETLSEPSLVSWSSSDTDGDVLYYRLFYSADSGTTWSMLTSNITATTFTVSPGDLAGTEMGLFKVVVSDGFHNAEDQSNGVFTVARKAPSVAIDTSLSDASVPLSTTVMLSGLVIDHEDDGLPDTSYAWTSALDGSLGVGSTVYASGLSAGIHYITLVVTDTDGMTGTHSIYLEVLEDTDGDLMSDAWERDVGLDPIVDDAYEDADKDGLSNVEEFHYGTDPLLFDTDCDGYDDLTEILWGSDPLDPDSYPRQYNYVHLPLVMHDYAPSIGPTNHPPSTLSNPLPSDGATNQSVNANLSWTGGDPDDDSVTYDVYFEAGDTTPDALLCGDVTSAFCDPGMLSGGMHYYWQVIARDEHEATTAGPVRGFATPAGWQEVGTGSATGGGISNNSGVSWCPSAAIAPDGTPYVAWDDDSGGDYEIYVRRWNGSSWEEVGIGSATGGGISDNNGESRHPSLAIASDGTPYVAWDDDSSGGLEIYVRRWNGSSWEEVGTGSASGGGISDDGGYSYGPSMAIAPDGTLYVAWQDQSGEEIYVRRWSGSSWGEVEVGSASGGGISDNSGESRDPSLAIAPDGTPYAAWFDDTSGDYEIYVRRWNGSSWEEVGVGSASGGGISDNSGYSRSPSAAIAPDGTPYIAWRDDSSGDYEIYVRRWNGSSWEEVGASSASGGGISDNSGSSYGPSMTIAADGTSYVVWYDDSGGDEEIYVRRRVE